MTKTYPQNVAPKWAPVESWLLFTLFVATNWASVCFAKHFFIISRITCLNSFHELRCGNIIRLQSSSCDHCTEGSILAWLRRLRCLSPFRLSLITLFDRCLRLLRSASLAASTRVTNPECLLRSADIMAAVAARFNSVRETSSRYGRVGFSPFARMYASPCRVLRSVFLHNFRVLKQL